MIEALAVALGGGVGAAARYVVDERVTKPWGTMVVNFVGSFILGLLVSLLLRGAPAHGNIAYQLLGTGFCGGFTTFSSASLEAVKIGRSSDGFNGAYYAIFMLVGAVMLAALGMGVGAVLLP